jgi:Domain of unknown function (DUF3291)
MSLQHHLAIYNFGLHVAPSGDSAIAGFVNREPLNFEAAARAEGYIDRSGYDGEPGPQSWGVQIFPRFIEGSGFTSGPSSLSLWADPESLLAFSYSGVHAEALKNARAWNVKQQWPPLVLFWVKAGEKPQWCQGVERLEYLADHGPTAFAFTFKQPFYPDGTLYQIDRARVKTIAARNIEGQQDLMQALAELPV